MKWVIYSESDFLIAILNGGEYIRLKKTHENYDKSLKNLLTNVHIIGGEIEDKEGVADGFAISDDN